MRSDPQNHESTELCKLHQIEYWPSEGCPDCRHNPAEEELSRQQWWEQLDADEAWQQQWVNTGK